MPGCVGFGAFVDRRVARSVQKHMPMCTYLYRIEGPKSDQAFPGGYSLLDCVVYSRVAGAACAEHLLGDSDGHVSLAALPGGGRIEGPISDQAFPGGNSLLDYVVTPAWQARYVPSRCWATVLRSFLSWRVLVEAIEGSKSDRDSLGGFSSGLRGLRPRGRRGVCRARVARQFGGHFSRHLLVEAGLRG